MRALGPGLGTGGQQVPAGAGSAAPAPQLLHGAEARAAAAPPGPCSPALLCSQEPSGWVLRGGAEQSAEEGLTPSSFPRKALASGVSLPLAAADMAGPLSRVLSLCAGRGGTCAGAGTAPLAPSALQHTAPDPCPDPWLLLDRQERQHGCCWGSLGYHQPLVLGRLASVSFSSPAAHAMARGFGGVCLW